MVHTRDLKIAKLLQHAVGQYFHQSAAGLDIYIDTVEMRDRRSADIYYQLGLSHPLEEAALRDLHQKILAHIPPLKKFIADNLNLKSIPKLSFHLRLHAAL